MLAVIFKKQLTLKRILHPQRSEKGPKERSWWNVLIIIKTGNAWLKWSTKSMQLPIQMVRAEMICKLKYFSKLKAYVGGSPAASLKPYENWLKESEKAYNH